MTSTNRSALVDRARRRPLLRTVTDPRNRPDVSLIVPLRTTRSAAAEPVARACTPPDRSPEAAPATAPTRHATTHATSHNRHPSTAPARRLPTPNTSRCPSQPRSEARASAIARRLLGSFQRAVDGARCAHRIPPAGSRSGRAPSLHCSYHAETRQDRLRYAHPVPIHAHPLALEPATRRRDEPTSGQPELPSGTL